MEYVIGADIGTSSTRAEDLNTLRNGILWNDMRCGDQVEQACKKLGI